MKHSNILIAHPSNKNELETIKAFFKALKIKFELANEDEYDEKFVSKIEKSRSQIKEGKTVKIDLDDIWK